MVTSTVRLGKGKKMPRLIDADKVAEAIAWLDEVDFVLWHDVQKCIDKLPTVDVVRHGHWVRHLDTRFGRLLNDIIICSCCGIAFSTEDMIRRSYCPNCGAKMDEEEK